MFFIWIFEQPVWIDTQSSPTYTTSLCGYKVSWCTFFGENLIR
jgi:hypothetical protein